MVQFLEGIKIYKEISCFNILAYSIIKLTAHSGEEKKPASNTSYATKFKGVTGFVFYPKTLKKVTHGIQHEFFENLFP